MKLLKVCMATLLVSVAGSVMSSEPLPCNDSKITRIVSDIVVNNYNEVIQSSGVKALDLVTVSADMPQVLGFNKPLRQRHCQLALTVTPLPNKVQSTLAYARYAIDHSTATGIPSVFMPQYYPEVYALLILEDEVKKKYLDATTFNTNYKIQMKEGSSEYIVSAELVGPYGTLKLMAAGEKFHRAGGK